MNFKGRHKAKDETSRAMGDGDVDVPRLLIQLKNQGVRPRLEAGGRLRVRSKKGALTAEVRALLKRHKAEIIAFLSESIATSGPSRRTGAPVPEQPPLSYAQERLWFIEKMGSSNAAYNMPVALDLEGPLAITAAERCLQQICERHDVLRACFPTRDGRPSQIVAPRLSLRIPVVDWADLADLDWVSWRLEETGRRFNLEQGPLIRIAVGRLGRNRHHLIVNMHHIISDGPSIEIFLREFAHGYRSLLLGSRPVWKPLPLQYGDYAHWQRTVQIGALEGSIAYWRARLEDAPSFLEMPTDHPRPAHQDGRGRTHEFRLPTETTERLTDEIQALGGTLFMGLLGIFAWLLARYSGQGDVVVGTPVNQRDHAALEPLMGLFVNTLALRMTLDDNPTFRDYLHRVKLIVLPAFGHREAPFEKVVECLAPPRDTSRTPLFQAMFTLAGNTFDTPLNFPGLSLTPVPAPLPDAKFDLNLHVELQGDQYVAALSYRASLFERPTIEAMATHFCTLLAAGPQHAQTRLAGIPMLRPDEREKLLHQWQGAVTPFPPDRFFPTWFETRVGHSPEAVALNQGEYFKTYRALNADANRLAHAMRNRGVGTESVVALALPRSTALVMGVVAVFKAGGAFLPLEPALPAARLKTILTDSGAAIVLTFENQGPWEEDLCLDLHAAYSAFPVTNPENKTLPDQRAYLLYTSGSTGLPKGVAVPHRGLANYLAWSAEAYRVRAGDTVPLYTSLSFDLTLTSLLLPLLAGGKLLIVDRETGLENLAALLNAFQRGIAMGFVKMTPSHLQTLCSLLVAPLPAWPRTLILGGESLTAAVVRAWHRYAPYTRIINEYGPTETVVGCSVHEASPGESAERDLPIGRPIANTRIFVLDRWGELQPPGPVGELYVAGPGVARGYHGRPGRTALFFLPNEMEATRPGARLYRTGDRARIKGNGVLCFLGRLDRQIKLRGHRIETGEIRKRLEDHPGILEAEVLLQEQGSEPRLVAYFVPGKELDTPSAPGIPGLRNHLGRFLPEYMLPAHWVRLDKLPLTPNGKRDLRALASREPDLENPARGPRNTLEMRMLSIWEEVLDTSPIGIRDHFFHLGGHSLAAVRLLSRIEQTFSTRLPVSAIFSSPTVAALTARLSRARDQPDPGPLLFLYGKNHDAPWFWVHPPGGEVHWYYPLARALEHYGHFGLQTATVGKRCDVPAMARTYVNAILSRFPKGPQRIGAWSAGGPIAFEMALLLEARGIAVEKLILLDASAPAHRQGAEPGSQEPLLAVAAAMFRDTAFDFAAWREELAPLDENQRFKRVAAKLHRAGVLPMGAGAYFKNIVSMYATHIQAVRRYRPAGKYTGETVLIRAVQTVETLCGNPDFEKAYGWQSHCTRPIRIYDHDADHFSLLTDESAPQIAALLASRF